MNAVEVVERARAAMGLSQGAFGELVGVSRRTMSRWTAGRTTPVYSQLTEMVALVYAKDPVAAAALAVGMGSTLEGLGIVRPPPPPPPALTHPALVLESIVHAAADAMDVAPRVARAGLAAALRRTRELGASLGDLEAWLAPPAPPKGG